MFAEVIVGRRTALQTLTYAVPASIIPYIRVGSQVVVPVRQRLVGGVVIKLTRRVAPELRTRLKDIVKVDKNSRGFSPPQIKTIEELAADAGASLAEVAFQALAFPSPISVTNKPFSLRKPLFVQAPWSDRLKFYERILKKYVGQKNLIFVFAVEAFAEEFVKNLPPTWPLFTDNLNAAKNKELSDALAARKPVVIVGGQKWAFFPLQPGDVMVIDLPDHIGLISQRRPYLSAKRIALTRAKTEGIQLVLGADAPSIADYLHFQSKRWQFLRQKLPAKEITIFHKTRSTELLLPNFATEIAQNTHQGRKILVFAASRGWATALYCRECGEIQQCQCCGRPVGLKNDHETLCRYCGQLKPLPTKCANGHSAVIALGEGVSQVASDVKKIIPNADITELVGDLETLPSNQVIVATEKILSFPAAQFDSVFIAAADQLLSGASPDGAWHLLEVLLALRAKTKTIFIQTRFSEHWLWSAIASGNLDEFYEQELAERKKYRLPPFGQELQVVGRAAHHQILEGQVKEIIKKIELAFPTATVSLLPFRFISKTNRELTLQLYRSTYFSRREKHFLRSLLPPSWTLIVGE